MPPKRIGPRNKCAVVGCDREERHTGLCSCHYNRKNKYGDVRAHIPIAPRSHGRMCAVASCERRSDSHGHCAMHWLRIKRFGSTDPPPPRQVMRRITHQGYVMLWAPDHPNANSNGNIFEHRLVVSERLGRPLLPSESVHHKNGDRKDNRVENLELWTRAQPSGQRVADKVAWAIELLRLYEPDALAAL